jgi:hypothetical protein
VDVEPATARLTIHRRSPRDEGERQLFVNLDGERLGMLGYGRELSCDVAPGPHRLRIHNTFWWKTVTFEARAHEDLHFAAVNVVPAAMVGVAAALGSAPMFVRIEAISAADADAARAGGPGVASP